MGGVTEGKLYFVELSTKERLEIMFVPKELALSRTADIAAIKVVARNTPKYQFTGGETELSFELDFFAEEEDRKDVFTKCSWLESMLYNDGYDEQPSKVQLVFGDLFKKRIWIIKSYNAKFDLFHKEKGYLPQQAYVSITLAMDPDRNVRRRDIRKPFGQDPGVPKFIASNNSI